MTLPGLFLLLLAFLGIYFLAMGRSAGPLAPPRQRWHLASFTLGLLAALAVFIPSPDLFGPEHRFTVSMGQFLLAVDLGPLLLFLGIPTGMLKPLLRWDALGRRLTRTLLAGLVSAALLLSWFVPVLFEAASRDLTLWILKQALFLLAGLILWWPVAGPLPTWRPAYPAQILYLFIMRIPTTLLGNLYHLLERIDL